MAGSPSDIVQASLHDESFGVLPFFDLSELNHGARSLSMKIFLKIWLDDKFWVSESRENK